MKRSTSAEDQITYALRQAESGTSVGDACRQLGISEATFYESKTTCAHVGVSELRRLRQLEEENARLKGLVADLTLDKHILQEAIRSNRQNQPSDGRAPSGSTRRFRSPWRAPVTWLAFREPHGTDAVARRISVRSATGSANSHTRGRGLAINAFTCCFAARDGW